MKHEGNGNGVDNSNIAKLRTALAINRGMEFLQKLPLEAGKTVEHHEARRKDYLGELYPDIHATLFKNWNQNGTPPLPRDIHDPGERKNLRILTQLLSPPNNGGNGQTSSDYLFNSNGIAVYHESKELAALLGNFYKKMLGAKPFDYGNELTL